MDQQYVLRWNKHHENLSDGVISYFERGLMCDVTITVGPRQKLKAHQAILSACSPYFESIFTENTHQNVTVMMVNVDHDILKAIIEYMYKGEVNIAQKLLPDFLKTAAHFQVKGLVDPENISQNADYDQHLPSSASPPIPPSDNDIDRKRPHIEHRNSLIAERFESEHESDSMHRDYDLTNENDNNRTELSPNLNDHIRKRRKDSICDNTLPHKRLHLRTPESNASSHSSYKISPLPKSNSNDVDAEVKRKSPNANHQLQQQPSIKQEEPSDAASSPQVHLSTTPNMYTHGSGPPTQFPGSDDILNSVGLHPNHEHENEQPIPHIEPGNEIDGSKAWHMRLTFERLSGGCNLHRCKLCGKVVTHIRNHYHVHYPGRFECPLCRATYTRSDNLRTHCKFKHPMFNPDTKKFENLMNPFAQQTAAIAAIAAANSFSAAASLNSVVQSHNEAMKPE